MGYRLSNSQATVMIRATPGMLHKGITGTPLFDIWHAMEVYCAEAI